MRNIKARYIWISVAISFLIAVGLIIGVTFTDGVWTNVVIVLIAIVFIYMTLAIQIASTKTFRYKAKKINYPTIEYPFVAEDIDASLKKKGYKPRVTPYGISYLKVSDTNAYKIVVIRNQEKYFNPEEQSENTTTEKSLEKCKSFIGFELFFDYDEETLRKLPDFSLQGENIYYTGFYFSEDKLVCPHYREPDETFKELYENMKKDLNISE